MKLTTNNLLPLTKTVLEDHKTHLTHRPTLYADNRVVGKLVYDIESREVTFRKNKAKFLEKIDVEKKIKDLVVSKEFKKKSLGINEKSLYALFIHLKLVELLKNVWNERENDDSLFLIIDGKKLNCVFMKDNLTKKKVKEEYLKEFKEEFGIKIYKFSDIKDIEDLATFKEFELFDQV